MPAFAEQEPLVQTYTDDEISARLVYADDFPASSPNDVKQAGAGEELFLQLLADDGFNILGTESFEEYDELATPPFYYSDNNFNVSFYTRGYIKRISGSRFPVDGLRFWETYTENFLIKFDKSTYESGVKASGMYLSDINALGRYYYLKVTDNTGHQFSIQLPSSLIDERGILAYVGIIIDTPGRSISEMTYDELHPSQFDIFGLDKITFASTDGSVSTGNFNLLQLVSSIAGGSYFKVNPAYSVEGNSSITFDIEFLKQPIDITTLSYSLESITAQPDENYIIPEDASISLSGINLNAGLNTTSVTINLNTEMNLNGNDVTFDLVVDNPWSKTGYSKKATGTIYATENIPTLTVSDASAFEQEEVITFSALIDKPWFEEIFVEWNTENGTATEDDYTSVKDGSFSFLPGSTTQTFSVNILDDQLDELTDESFYVNIKPTSSFNCSSDPCKATGTIRKLNTVTASIHDTATMVNAGSSFDVKFKISEPLPFDISIAYEFAMVEDEHTVDQVITDSNNGVVTIPKGTVEKSITVETKNITTDANVTLTITSASDLNFDIQDTKNISIIASSATTAGFEQTAFTVFEGDSVDLSIVLDEVAQEQYVFIIKTLIGGTQGASDFSEMNDKQIILQPGSNGVDFRITTVDDSMAENDEAFIVQIIDSSPTLLLTPSSATITIKDND